MAEMIVLGAGMNGLAAAALLARDGHRVTVLERDPAEPSGDAHALWERWDRRGVNQFMLLHFMLPKWRELMEAELPEVLDALRALGGADMNFIEMLPESVTGGFRPGDEVFSTVNARRPVLEAALAQVAAATAGVTIRRGCTVRALITRADAVPHVEGVVLQDGERLTADLVIDTAGRRSPVADMLEAAGARRPGEVREDSGFVYYTRHFRSVDGSRPDVVASLLQHYASVSVLTLPCDNDTWGVGIIASSQDSALRALREVPAWEETMKLFPAAAHWASVGEPITDIQVLSGVPDICRRYVVDGGPVVTGIVAVGDAWAATNPSLGRGASIGMLHVRALRDVLRETSADQAVKVVLRFDEVTQEAVMPYFEMTRTFDRHRLAEITADIEGGTYETADVTWPIGKALYAAALLDPDLLRAYLSIVALAAFPADAVADPEIFGRILDLGLAAPPTGDGPSRAAILAAAAPR